MYPSEPIPSHVPMLPSDTELARYSLTQLQQLHMKFTRYGRHLLTKLAHAKSIHADLKIRKEKAEYAVRREIREQEPETDRETRKELVETDIRIIDIDVALMNARAEEEFFNAHVKANDKALRAIEEQCFNRSSQHSASAPTPDFANPATGPRQRGRRRE